VDISFEKLIRLQHVDMELQTISSFLDAIPVKIETIDGEIRATSDVVTQAKEKLAANQKKRRDLEAEVKDNKIQVGKFKRQLNEIKDNRAYSALLKEIDESELKVDKIEEDIIQEMIAADDIEKEIKAANLKKAEEERRLLKEKESISRDKKELEEKKEKMAGERQTLLPQIPSDQLRLYLRISKKMSGVAMSPIADDFCSLCQMRIRPQILNELMEMNKIIMCEACGRILYWQKPRDEESEEEEKADNPDKIDDSATG
jgi:hypothetical protein